jgi:hypothetical protein
VLAAWARKEAESDREVMEKASRAFVSLVRGYKEHHCKFVFRLQVGLGLEECGQSTVDALLDCASWQ